MTIPRVGESLQDFRGDLGNSARHSRPPIGSTACSFFWRPRLRMRGRAPRAGGPLMRGLKVLKESGNLQQGLPPFSPPSPNSPPTTVPA
jgi:hypothetical protein